MKRILSCLASLSLAASAVAQTQANTGQIEGSVLDPSGAAVPGASVKLRNTATNQLRSLTTDARGFYRAPLLQIGAYEISVESPQFATHRRSNSAPAAYVAMSWRSRSRYLGTAVFGSSSSSYSRATQPR